MSTLKVNNLQVGQSATASQNFTLYQPSTPDGTVRLGYGNPGSVTDTLTVKNDGSVGIGVTNPTEKLQVVGRITSTLAIRAGTSSAVASSNELLSVLGQASIRNDGTVSAAGYLINADTTASTTQPFLYFSDTAGNRAGWGIRYSDTRSVLYGQGGLSFQTGTSGFNESNERVRITSTGNIGIGTTTSYTTGGNYVTTILGSDILAAGPSSANMFYIRYQGVLGHYAWQTYHSTSNSGAIQLQPYGGNVGIGTTNPTYKLDVEGSSNITTQLSLWGKTIGQPQTLVEPGRIYATSAGLGPGQLLLNPTGGNVGIGTDNPGSRLTVFGGSNKTSSDGALFVLSSQDPQSSAFQLVFQRTAGGSGAYYSIQSVEQNTGYRDILFQPNGGNTEFFGNVGIGTTNPSYLLHSAGTSAFGDATYPYIIQYIGFISNGSTFTLPAGRWMGELHYIWGNNTGRSAKRIVAFSKAPGAINNGYSSTITDLNNGGSGVLGYSFNQSTGVFTWSVSDGSTSSGYAWILYHLGA